MILNCAKKKVRQGELKHLAFARKLKELLQTLNVYRPENSVWSQDGPLCDPK